MKSFAGDRLPSPAMSAWIVLAPAGCAWLTLLLIARFDSTSALCVAPRAVWSDGAWDAAGLALSRLSVQQVLGESLLMTIAMALPFAWQPASDIRSRSFRSTRPTLLTLFVAAFMLVWTLAMAWLLVAGVMIQAALSTVASASVIAAGACALVVLHRLSPLGQSALALCHRLYPVRAFAPACRHDAVLAGFRTGVDGVRFCWPGMLLPWLTTAPVLVMAVVTATGLIDRTAFRQNPWPAAIALLLMSAVNLVTPA